MASVHKSQKLNDHAVASSERGSENSPTGSSIDRQPSGYSKSLGRDIRDPESRDRRSRSPDRNDSASSSRRQAVSYRAVREAAEARDRERRSKEAEKYKKSRGIKEVDPGSRSPRSDRKKLDSYRSSQPSTIDTKQSQEASNMPGSKGTHSNTASYSPARKPDGIPITPIVAPTSAHSNLNSRLELTGALKRFMTEVTEQASLQIQRDSAKRALDRRIAEYEKSKSFHEDFPSTAEAQRAAKDRALRDFEELERELTRKREGSLALIEDIADSVLPDSRASTTQPEIERDLEGIREKLGQYQGDCEDVKKAQERLDQLYRSSHTDFKKDLETVRVGTQDDLTSIRQDFLAWDIQVANLAAELEELKSSKDSIMQTINSVSSSINSLPDLRQELSKATEQINATLGIQSETIAQLNANLKPEIQSLQSAVVALDESDGGLKNTLTNLEATVSAVGLNVGATTERLEAVSEKLKAIENDSKFERGVTEKVEAITSRLDAVENGQGIQMTISDQLATVDNRLKAVEESQSLHTAATERTEPKDNTLKFIDDGQRTQRTITEIADGTDQKRRVINSSRITDPPADGENLASAIPDQRSTSALWGGVLRIRTELKREMRLAQEAGDELMGDIMGKLDNRVGKLEEGSQLAHDMVQISAEIQALKEDVNRPKNWSGPIGAMTAALAKTNEKITQMEATLGSDVEGINTGLINLDFRMNNLSTSDLARQIIGQMEAHVRGTENTLATIVLRTQEVEKRISVSMTNIQPRLQELEQRAIGNFGHLQHRLQELEQKSIASVELGKQAEESTESLRQELKAHIESMVESASGEMKIEFIEAHNVFANSLRVTQTEVKSIANDLFETKANLDASKATFTDVTASLQSDVENLSGSLKTVQDDVEASKTSIIETTKVISAEIEKIAKQRNPSEKRKAAESLMMTRSNGHKKRKAAAMQSGNSSDDDEYRSAAD